MLAVGAAHRALAHQDPQGRAVAPDELALHVTGVELAAPQVLEVLGELLAPLLVEGVEDREVEQLGGLGPEHAREGRVGEEGAPLEVEHPDAVGRRLDDVPIQRVQLHTCPPGPTIGALGPAEGQASPSIR